MLKKECFTREWIDKVREDNPPADPTIVEKTIYAFELLSLLKMTSLNFIFKGGTSLLLLLENPRRLSIDIDIITNENKENVEKTLSQIVKESVFKFWQEDVRRESKIPKKHYKLFFDSVINPQHNSYILLDVLFQENPYPKTISKILRNRFIATDENVECIVPSVDSLIGDKLTAFAPDTIGIPFGVGKSMQIQKQLFDIGSLFPLSKNINEIEESFKNFVLIESGYREKSFSVEDVIKDIKNTTFLITQMQLRKAISNEKTTELYEGIAKLRSHLIGISYNLETAKIFASRTAFLVYSISSKEIFGKFKEYSIDNITNEKLKGKYQILERIKTILPEAYYYWQVIDNLQTRVQ